MIRYFEEYTRQNALRTVQDFLEYINYEGEACIGYTNSAGHELDDCIQVMDDEGHGVFLIFISDIDELTFQGVMCESRRAPKFTTYPERYTLTGRLIPVLRWGLGI